MDKRFLGILGALFIIFVAIFAISQSSSDKGSSGKNNSNSQVTHHVMGENQKKVTLQEYGDYQCPVCGAYYLPLKQAAEKYKNDIQFQFSNLPLTAIHQNAFAGARAAEAAGLQNKYWEMHDKLYENQNQWTSLGSPIDTFTQYAQQLGMDVSKFKQDYASSQVNDAINADLDAFDKTGAEKSTPSLFVNGRHVPNSDFVDPQTGQPTLDSISKVIESEFNKQ
jgi:protein-disulfide isomerase